MWRPWLYLWTVALLLLHTALAESPFSRRSFYIDVTCPPNVKDAINEAIYVLLPLGWSMRSEPHLQPIIDYLYPLLKKSQRYTMFRMSTSYIYIITMNSLLTAI